MSDNGVETRMTGYVESMVDRAGEIFADLMGEHVSRGSMSMTSLTESDKRVIERLFSQAVHSHVLAEISAIVSFLIYLDVNDDSILGRVVPAFLDRVEEEMEEVPDSLVARTGDLVGLARGVLESGADRRPVVAPLLEDIAGMSPVRHLRASYEAVLLSFLGE